MHHWPIESAPMNTHGSSIQQPWLKPMLNVKAIVMHAFPQRQQGSGATTRDFVIVNEEKKPMLLTLWNEFEETEGSKIASTIAAAPVIIAMRIKVTTFNTLSLTSRLSSSFLLNPPLPELMQMKEWFSANKEDLNNLFEAKAYKDPSFLLPLPKEEDIRTIKTAQDAFETNQRKAIWIRGDTKLVAGQTKFWYTCCLNCQKTVSADVDWTITCPSCKECTQTEVRCRIAITLTDPTGTLDSVIFGEDAEKLIPFTAAKLKEADESGTNIEVQLADSINKHTIVCFLRNYDVEFHGQIQKRHGILKAYTLDEFLPLSPPPMHRESSIAAIPVAPAVISNQKITSKHEMFTPTTKLILEEIAEKTTAADKDASTSIGVKRILSFDEKATENPLSAAESSSSATKTNPVHQSLQFPSQASTPFKKDMQASPSKKPKDSLLPH